MITMDWNTSKRRGEVFFDHNQNSKGKTLVSAFSARPTLLATISMPLEWDIIDRNLPTEFTIRSVAEKIADQKDPYRVGLASLKVDKTFPNC
jgi:bifunctional non-homologous end joining protein LigD